MRGCLCGSTAHTRACYAIPCVRFAFGVTVSRAQSTRVYQKREKKISKLMRRWKRIQMKDARSRDAATIVENSRWITWCMQTSICHRHTIAPRSIPRFLFAAFETKAKICVCFVRRASKKTMWFCPGPGNCAHRKCQLRKEWTRATRKPRTHKKIETRQVCSFVEMPYQHDGNRTKAATSDARGGEIRTKTKLCSTRKSYT